MPLYKAWESDAYSQAAIWKIEEPEAFFSDATGLQFDISHERRRLERHAGRYLLQLLKADFPLARIAPDTHDKPRLPGNPCFFSISHSWPYVAAVVSPWAEAGIDIQCWRPGMDRLQHKYLSQAEQQLLGADARSLTLAWSAKEAAYKWQGRRGVDFREHLPITNLYAHEQELRMEIRLELLNPAPLITVAGWQEPAFAVAWVRQDVPGGSMIIV
jgi:phosphopantetheinyl transferase